MARASEIAYSALRAEILDWQLEPGAVLAEVEQANRLGISRTPVREALMRLFTDGLVEPQGARGLVVAAVSTADVVALFELRQALEQQAASLAATRRRVEPFEALRDELRAAPDLLDVGRRASVSQPTAATTEHADRQEYYNIVARFDREIDLAIDSPFLLGALEGVRTHLSRIRRLSRDNPRRLLQAADEHLTIVEAIIAGDAALAAHATHLHLHRSLQVILQSLTEQEHPAS